MHMCKHAHTHTYIYIYLYPSFKRHVNFDPPVGLIGRW